MGKLVDEAGDPAISTLKAVLDTAELLRQLSNVLPHGNWDASREVRLRVRSGASRALRRE